MRIEDRSDELELLGLKPAEKKILAAISILAKTPATIAHHIGIPRTSVDYMLIKLQEKSYVVCILDGKRKFWKSNVSKILRYIHNLENGTVLRKEHGI